ncbi:membrane protein [Mycobacterium Phage Nergal]|nr:membrane protein [Mycobacterium Phage Nergal]
MWGTAGEWVGGLGSAGALLLALYILLRDRRLRERAQADRVACWLEFSEHDDAAAHLINTSDMPIIKPVVWAIPKFPWVVWYLKRKYPSFHHTRNPQKVDHRHCVQVEFKPYTEGLDVQTGEQQVQGLGLRYNRRLYHYCVEFRDISNRRWIRNLTTGKYVGRRYRLRRWWAWRRWLTEAEREFKAAQATANPAGK